MWGTIISLLGTAASGILSGVANKKQQANLEKQRQEANNYYQQQDDKLLAELAQDPTKRSENVALLNQLDSKLKRLNEIDAAKAKITGATHEHQMAMRQKNADAYSNAISDMVRNASARRDLIQNQRQALSDKRFAQQQGFDTQQTNINKDRMQNYANLAQNAFQLAGSAADAKFGTPKAGTTDTTGTKKLTYVDHQNGNFGIEPPKNVL